MTEKEIEAYKAFMYDVKNLNNCEECPHGNDGFESGETGNPCGQFRCWVYAHCHREL